MYFWSGRDDFNLRPPTPHVGARPEKSFAIVTF